MFWLLQSVFEHEASITLGIFTTQTLADISGVTYTSQSGPDCQLQLQELVAPHEYGEIVYVVSGHCEMQGDVEERIEFVAFTLQKALSQGRILYQENHKNFLITEDGEHHCVGLVDWLLLDEVRLDELRFHNQSVFFDVQCTVLELESQRVPNYQATLKNTIRESLISVDDHWIDLTRCQNQNTYPVEGWPGTSYLEELGRLLKFWFSSFPPDLHRHEILPVLKFRLQLHLRLRHDVYYVHRLRDLGICGLSRALGYILNQV
jgi:hypothetical protein